jgi:hypothetical protein
MRGEEKEEEKGRRRKRRSRAGCYFNTWMLDGAEVE